jgi:hypothetical protein
MHGEFRDYNARDLVGLNGHLRKGADTLMGRMDGKGECE